LDNSVGEVPGYWVEGAMGLTWPPIQWVPGCQVEQPGCEADDSLPSNSEGKNGGAIAPLPCMSSWHST
jgi:hypothetical protein